MVDQVEKGDEGRDAEETRNPGREFRRRVVAMTRGVSWPPAIWIAISIDPKVKMMKDVVRPMMA